MEEDCVRQSTLFEAFVGKHEPISIGQPKEIKPAKVDMTFCRCGARTYVKENLPHCPGCKGYAFNCWCPKESPR